MERLLYKIITTLVFILTKVIFRLEVKGEENVPRAGGFILASNHGSYLDPVILGGVCSCQLSFMARDDLFNIPIFGSLIRSLGAFPVRRNFSDIASIREALRRLQQVGGVVIFPQGRRVFDGTTGDVESGIGLIAAKSGVPVIPVFIRGSQRAMGSNAHFIRPVKIKVYFGKPLYAKTDIHRDNYKDFAREVMQEIKQLGREDEVK